MTSLFDTPISTAAPMDMFQRKYHPVSRQHFLNVSADTPLPTNKFYSNLFLDTQAQGCWTLPYMQWWNKDPTRFGFSVSHIDSNQLSLGPEVSPGIVEYYISPLGIASITFSATEFNASTSSMKLTDPTEASVNAGIYADLARYGSATKRMTLPLVQGMGFVTAEYKDLVPKISSNVMFRRVEPLTGPSAGLQKWRLTLEDGKIWVLYARAEDGGAPLTFNQQGNNFLTGSRSFTGFCQVSKLPVGSAGLEGVVDATAGTYAAGRAHSGIVSGSTGRYTFSWQRRGQSVSGNVLMYALKHHVASFSPETASARTGMRLNSTTKGIMEAVAANSWTMVEDKLPTGIGFMINGVEGLTPYAKGRVAAQVKEDLNVDFVARTGGESWYFSGKAFGKIAQDCLTATYIGLDGEARAALVRLKAAFATFVENHPFFSLVYDTNWRGIVSDALFKTGDAGRDFGNSNYNDHHFHYGYHIYTAAVIAHLDQRLGNGNGWIVKNKPFIDTLLRDVANPNTADKYFTTNRAFDVFHGHSWAKGLFESGDGKDQESSSEDVHFSYAMKLWGVVSGDDKMRGRGDLQLAILSRSFNEYFLLQTGNTSHPQQFVPNKVTGILFENKVHHTTYFGHLAQYIHGIHMLPFSPMTPYVRTPKFVAEEWATWFEGRTAEINDSWKSVLYGNVASFQPRSSWLFFDQAGFNPAWTSDGASRSWHMINAALLGGAPPAVSNYTYGSNEPIYRETPTDNFKYVDNAKDQRPCRPKPPKPHGRRWFS